MRPNLFSMQVLGLIAFIPAFIILEFNHSKVQAPEKEISVTVAKVTMPVVADTVSRAVNKGFPHGIVLLYY